jgi:hypothetical protein
MPKSRLACVIMGVKKILTLDADFPKYSFLKVLPI